MQRSLPQRLVAGALIVAGSLWFVLIPERFSLGWDTVASVGLAVGLVGSGLAAHYATRARRVPLALGTLLLWSLIANVSLMAWANASRDAWGTMNAGIAQETGRELELHRASLLALESEDAESARAAADRLRRRIERLEQALPGLEAVALATSPR